MTDAVNTVYIENGEARITRPTANLRFIKRDGQRILQQAFEKISGPHTSFEWRDIPLIEEDTPPPSI